MYMTIKDKMDPAVNIALFTWIGVRRKRKRSQPASLVGMMVMAFVTSSFIASVPVLDAFYSAGRRIHKVSKSHSSSELIERIHFSSIWVSIADDRGGTFGERESRPVPTSDVQRAAAFGEIQRMKAKVKAQLDCGNFKEVLDTAKQVLHFYTACAKILSQTERYQLSAIVDAAFMGIFQASFAPPFDNLSRIFTGVDVIHLQLSATCLETPYNNVSRRTLLDAISALTSKLEDTYEVDESLALSRSSTRESYYILQRLIANVGVRGKSSHPLSEKEFAQVLRAHCQNGLMETAEQIVKLQERTPRGPPLSPVAYSILLKGYGQKCCLESVQKVFRRAIDDDIEFDVIMMNTLIDAYVNCNAMDEAKKFFLEMKQGTLSPNRRTYNTYLKGLSRLGSLDEAIILSDEMKQLRLWDSVTTNTLVHAAVVAENFTFAEGILAKETLRPTKYLNDHPNVQAYTELIDVYCKMDQLDRALGILRTMQLRGVEPNVVTYACLMSGLGKNNCVDLARKISCYMKARGLPLTTRIYSSLISGLLDETDSDLDKRVDEGIRLLREMISVKVLPDASLMSLIVDAMGRCIVPRVAEAQSLVNEFERLSCIPTGDNRVATSLLRLYGKTCDIKGVLDSFQKVKTPDRITVNAFMDACCRCDREKFAVGAFDRYFGFGNNILCPDVASYAILIGSCLKRNSVESVRRVHLLYRDMKTRRHIRPDNGLIDVILKGMIRIGTNQLVSKEQITMFVEVLEDAEELEWEDGQLDRRKRAVQTVLTEKSDDDFFRRKGWNQVDSGFRLWGSIDRSSKTTNQSDRFLTNHGWNDVDSSFRVF